MATATFNPFPSVGTQLTNGLASVSTLNPSTVTTAQLVTQIYNYIQSVYYPSTGTVPQDVQTELQATIYNAINGYNNNLLSTKPLLTPGQQYFANLLLGLQMTSTVPINSIGTWISDIEDNITKSGLDTDEQNVLLLATQVASTMYNYWVSQVAAPNSYWTTIFSSNTAENYANIGHWTAAAITGALIGATLSPGKGTITPTTDIQSVMIISALAGALGVGAGKPTFGWVPRIQPVQDMAGSVINNMEPIASLGGAVGGYPAVSKLNGTCAGGGHTCPYYAGGGRFGGGWVMCVASPGTVCVTVGSPLPCTGNSVCNHVCQVNSPGCIVDTNPG